MPNSNNPLTLDTGSADVIYLHVNLNKLSYTILKHELGEWLFGVGKHNALLALQAKYHLARTGSFDEATRVALTSAVAEEGTEQNNVEGGIFFDYGVPASGVNAPLLSRGIRETKIQLGKAKEAGIVNLNDHQITFARTAFENFTLIALSSSKDEEKTP